MKYALIVDYSEPQSNVKNCIQDVFTLELTDTELSELVQQIEAKFEAYNLDNDNWYTLTVMPVRETSTTELLWVVDKLVETDDTKMGRVSVINVVMPKLRTCRMKFSNAPMIMDGVWSGGRPFYVDFGYYDQSQRNETIRKIRAEYSNLAFLSAYDINVDGYSVPSRNAEISRMIREDHADGVDDDET